MDFNHERVRELRERRGLSVRAFAELCGVSPSFVSQVERGRAVPTLTRFWRMCQVLDTPMSYFFEGGPSTEAVLRREDQRPIHFPESGTTWHPLSPPAKKSLDLLLIEIAPGNTHDRRQLSHTGEECGYVLDGELVILLGPEEIRLRTGDSVCLNATLPHRFVNPGATLSRSVWAISPPLL
jgi:transcriptional regulator with XRE-family HTH domain